MAESTPTIIGRYEIRREIGRGTMGVVYEAHDPLLGRNIALKTIHVARSLSPREHAVFEERFFAEARAAARLAHPAIVVVHDVGRDPATGTLFMAMEYLQGRVLADVVRQGRPVDWREALRITRGIALALHHAHAHGVVHRDIKPANVMLVASGEPKIMDFGVAKIETARIQMTAAGQSFGTPLYMSPEQALGGKVDGRSDLFSLGSIAYSLLTGRPAFAAETITRIVERVMKDDPEPPSRVVPELPADVDLVIAHALAKNPNDRYPDGRTLAEDLEDLLAERPPRHGPGAAAAAPDPDLDQLLADQRHTRIESELPTVDLEAQLATLVPQPGGEPAQADLPATDPPAAQPLPAAQHTRLGEGLEVWAIAVLVAAGLVALAISVLGRRGEGPHTAPGRPAGDPRGEPARLAIALEHPLKTGSVRIWLDRELVAEQKLDVRQARRVTAFAFRKGGSQDLLELEPGGHDVEVQVAWDGKEKAARIWGDFQPGATLHLEAKVGGLFKSLSLEWQ